MSKPATASTPKPAPVAPKAVEPVQPAPTFDATKLDDKALNAIWKALQSERKARAERAKANGVQVGQQVIVRDAKSKWVGKEGTVILARKTRAFVQFPNVLSPAYLLISDLEKVVSK